ncbi:signal peptidase I [Marinicrinis sediminis]|uniref:Signal peptidase I n=1 Tax=Marinicrinis sediminis TaxID=1652465 RepID=A0ABW5R796_9BACL
MIRELLDWIKTIAIALVLVLLIKTFLLGNYQVEGQSMEPNFYDGERIIVNKIIYDFREPKRGEVIVLHSPDGRDFIKRIIALPGETIEVKGDDVLINGEKLEEPYLEEAVRREIEQGRQYNYSNDPLKTVPEDQYFVMGDNRPYSKDSREIGFIPADDIVGRADLIYWPFPDFQLLRYD